MKFFKYLIFILLSSISFDALSAIYRVSYVGTILSQGEYSSYSEACKSIVGKGTSFGEITAVYPAGSDCQFKAGNSAYYAFIEILNINCPSSVTSENRSGDITKWTPDQTQSYLSTVPQSACYQGCRYKSPSLGADNSSSFSITYGYPSADSACANITNKPVIPPNPYQNESTACKNGESYCEKPTTGCPSGYTSGSFNGKDICVKNSTDPTKPNPNDPNNMSNFDDSRIIAAINDSKNAITTSINNAADSINKGINSIKDSIATVTTAVNATTDAVNTNTNAVNAVKSSVDALHNTINAVTTAVNNNTNQVTSAVNANTSATNAVKASVDALNSTVSAVTTAVDNNTKAVNANGDKVANAVKDNTTATNAVKTAVESLNSSVNAVTTAVNANGDKVTNSVNANGDKVSNSVNANGDKVANAVNASGNQVSDAVNKGTDVAKENGKKLDGINEAVKEGNGHLKGIKDLLKDIKDWLTGDTPEDGKDEIPQKELNEKTFDTGRISVGGSDCPPDKQINWQTPFGLVSYTISYQDLCQSSGWIGYLILASAYLLGAQIVMRDS